LNILKIPLTGVGFLVDARGGRFLNGTGYGKEKTKQELLQITAMKGESLRKIHMKNLNSFQNTVSSNGPTEKKNEEIELKTAPEDISHIMVSAARQEL
jgi:hypothetical protein